MSDRGLTHLDPLGRARMVDVTPKEATHRRAIARCRVNMQAETTALVARGAVSKGDVLAVARIAGKGPGHQIGAVTFVQPPRSMSRIGG